MAEKLEIWEGASAAVANFVIKYRILIVSVLTLITIFFLFQFKNFKLATDFGELIPQKHPYIRVHNKFRDIFGGANIIQIEFEVKEGDIFNARTLEKISKISNGLTFINGVNISSVFAISQRKAKNFKIGEGGTILSQCLMWPDIPKTKEEIENLKSIIHSNEMYFGPYVSVDDKAVLITADLYEWGLNYERIYRDILKLCNEAVDSNTEIYMAGTPILYGFLYVNLYKIIYILLFSVGIMIVLLFSYSRKLIEVIIPLLSATITGIWGLGFATFLGYSLDPLIIVVPILLSTRIVSHSLQLIERYFEEYRECRDKKTAVKKSIEGVFFPGLAGIVTDAAGILVIALVPIPILQKLGIINFSWAIFSTLIVLILNPVILSFWPAPVKLLAKAKEEKKDVLDKILYWVGSVTTKKSGSWAILLTGIALLFLSFWASLYLVTGDTRPGTPILWPDSRYNQDVKHISQKFPGTNPLLIAIEGNEDHAVKSPELLQVVEKYQRMIEKDPTVGGSVSAIDVVKRINMLFHEGDTKWDILPKDFASIGTFMYVFTAQSDPGDFDRYADNLYKNASIVVYYKDKLAPTVTNAMNKAREFFESNPVKGLKFSLAGGVIGIMAAMNETLINYQMATMVVSLIVTAGFCAIFLASFLSGFLLISSLIIANYIVFGYMALMNIGVDVNTLPVASIAIGIGVDYGIYVYGRIREEFVRLGDINQAIITAIMTTGKAVTFTVITIVGGVFVWYYSFIRFQADMGLLLTLVTLCHLVGCLFFLPALIVIIKPKFICKL